GLVFLLLKEYGDAEKAFRDGLEAVRALPPGQRRNVTARLKHQQAALYRAQGDYSRAGRLFGESLGLLDELTYPTHPDAAVCRADLAWTLACEKKWPEAFKAMDLSRQHLCRHAKGVLATQSELEQLSFRQA